VKERVEVPWSPKISTPSDTTNSSQAAGDSSKAGIGQSPSAKYRILSIRNFNKALKEITPSLSESLGTLADLRKWNEEFGEGRKQKRRQIWGKDMFGFSNKLTKSGEEGRVGASK
jgi:hypothetical protein